MPARKPKKETAKAKKASKSKKPKAPPIDRSPAAFEKAFAARLGCAPATYIQRKIEAGNSVDDIRYLYELEASGIATMNYCVAQPFERYYDPKTMKRKEAVHMAEPEKSTVTKTRVNRLVRDRIPELMEARGKSCATEVLPPEDYLVMLEAKLGEELAAYQKSKSLEELADLLEVMGAVVKARGHTWDELTKIRKQRVEKYGDFSGRTLLWEVVE